MKRIYIAVVLVLLTLCIGALETGYVTAKTDMFIDKIERADKLMKRNEFSEAIKLCQNTEKEWYDNAKAIDMLLIHDYVDDIGLSISKMTSFAESKNTDMYFSESSDAKKQLASIKESEYPLIENLL